MAGVEETRAFSIEDDEDDVQVPAGTPPQISSQDWTKILEDELQSGFADAESIRKLLEGRRVPPHLRHHIWKVVLGVSSKPDVLSGQKSRPFESSPALRADCEAALARFPNIELPRTEAAEEMEVILSFFSRARGSDYDAMAGWPEILVPLMGLPISRGDRYNCFYSLVSRFLFKALGVGGVPFPIFRLLLLYHDPELCNALDSRRISPEQYSQLWFRTLFGGLCSPDVVYALWDHIFLANDPLFILFLGLVMLVNARDIVLQGGEGIPAELQGIPSALTFDDVDDLCALAEHYSNLTPNSFRTQYSGELFTSASKITAKPPGLAARTALCLPVSVETLLDARSRDGNIKYFVVDCREAAAYDGGHLPQAWHLDAQLMLNSPTAFAAEVRKLEEAIDTSMHHPCFFGSGQIEVDDYIGMVASHFLQRRQKYVSIAHGGYEALHCLLDTLAMTASVLDSHTPAACVVCQAQEPRAKAAGKESKGDGKAASKGEAKDAGPASAPVAESKKESKKESKGSNSPRVSRAQSEEAGGAAGAAEAAPSAMAVKLSTWAAAWKEKKAQAAALLKEKSAQYSASLKEKSRAVKERFKDGIKRDASANTPYRSSDIPAMFSIDDDDDTAPTSGPTAKGIDGELGSAVLRHTTKGQITVDLGLLRDQPAVKHVFLCSEIYTDGAMYPTHLVLTASHAIKLRELRVGRDEAVVLARRPLRTICKITAKKKHPTLVTLAFEDDGTHTDCSELFGSPVARVEESEIGGSAKAGSSDSAGASGEKMFVLERFMIPEADTAKDALKTLVTSSRQA